jgi:Skp family chaperone for outer membrane proteins
VPDWTDLDRAYVPAVGSYHRDTPTPWANDRCRVIYNSQPGVPMKHMSQVVQQLKKEREQVQKQLQRIDEALAALGSSSNGATRTMSAAGRRRISLAQKARWAKAKGHAPKPKRTISLAGRRRIAAAQRARWAKVKSAA